MKVRFAEGLGRERRAGLWPLLKEMHSELVLKGKREEEMEEDTLV